MDAGAGRARAEQQQQQPQHGPSAAGRHLCSSVSVPRAPLPGQASHVSGGARHVTAVGGAGSCQGVMEGLGMGGAEGSVSATPCPGRDTSRCSRGPLNPSNPARNASRGAASPSLSDLCQSLTAFLGKNFLPIFSLNFPFFGLSPLSFALSLHFLPRVPLRLL